MDAFLAHSPQHSFSPLRLQHLPPAHDPAFMHLLLVMHDSPSLPPWQHAIATSLLAFSWQQPVSFSPAFFWQQGHLAFVSDCAAGAFCASGAVWVAFCAHAATASVSASTTVIAFIADFIFKSPFMNAELCRYPNVKYLRRKIAEPGPGPALGLPKGLRPFFGR
jgi:hypothetical protein